MNSQDAEIIEQIQGILEIVETIERRCSSDIPELTNFLCMIRDFTASAEALSALSDNGQLRQAVHANTCEAIAAMEQVGRTVLQGASIINDKILIAMDDAHPHDLQKP